jgi:O-antigen ligase
LGYTQIFLTKSPQNFVLGTGLGEFFRKVQKPYYDDRIMERLIFPHSIFINFWTETGILGMLAITVILGYTFYLAYKIRRTDKLIGAGILAALTVLVVHGLVDVPYFKNDLSFLFWIIMALPILLEYEDFYKSQTNVL